MDLSLFPAFKNAIKYFRHQFALILSCHIYAGQRNDSENRQKYKILSRWYILTIIFPGKIRCGHHAVYSDPLRHIQLCCTDFCGM